MLPDLSRSVWDGGSVQNSKAGAPVGRALNGKLSDPRGVLPSCRGWEAPDLLGGGPDTPGTGKGDARGEDLEGGVIWVDNGDKKGPSPLS